MTDVVLVWQPIDTAPKGDDDFFLVCGVGDDRSAFVVRGSILKSARKDNAPSHLHLHWLTHWMPLPPKPKFTEQTCPGHIASDDDAKVCGRCGIHIDSLR